MHNSFASLLEEKGHLHDCEIERIVWDTEARSIDVFIKDVDSNFLGLSEYLGPSPGKIVAKNVRGAETSFHQQAGKMRIFEAVRHTEGNIETLELKLSPSGVIAIKCESLDLVFSNAGASGKEK